MGTSSVRKCRGVCPLSLDDCFRGTPSSTDVQGTATSFLSGGRVNGVRPDLAMDCMRLRGAMRCGSRGGGVVLHNSAMRIHCLHLNIGTLTEIAGASCSIIRSQCISVCINGTDRGLTEAAIGSHGHVDAAGSHTISTDHITASCVNRASSNNVRFKPKDFGCAVGRGKLRFGNMGGGLIVRD